MGVNNPYMAGSGAWSHTHTHFVTVVQDCKKILTYKWASLQGEGGPTREDLLWYSSISLRAMSIHTVLNTSVTVNLLWLHPFVLNFRLKTYPNLTACSSAPEARICILLVSFEWKHSEVCGNVECRRI